MTVTVTQQGTQIASRTVGLTPTSPGCASTPAGTVCAFQLGIPPGAYMGALSTYDGANGTGNALSVAQGVAFTVVAGQNNEVLLTLSGIPAKVVPTYLGGGRFVVAAQDADGNNIVGNGAPSFTVAKGGGATVVSIAQPTASSPNAFSIAPIAIGTETLTITAGSLPGGPNICTPPDAVCTANFTASYTQQLFVANTQANNVLDFSVPFVSSVQLPTRSFPARLPQAVLLDPTGNLFFAGYSPNSGPGSGAPLDEVRPPYSAGVLTGATVYAANGLALDTNDDLYAIDNVDNEVQEFAPSYAGPPAASVTGAGINGPSAVVVDNGDFVYVANSAAANVTIYSPPISPPPFVTIATGSDPQGLYFDGSGNLWVTCFASNTIEEFKPPFSNASVPVATISNGISGPIGPIASDGLGNFFVANSSNDTITEYSPPFSNSSSPVATISANGSPHALVVDGAGNLYSVNSTGGAFPNGSIAAFAPPFSNSSTPVVVVSSGLNQPSSAAITSGVAFSVTIP